MNLSILRNGTVIATVPIDRETLFSQKLMGEHKITASIVAATPLPVQIGDYVEHDGERFYLNAPPKFDKINNFTYNYELVFEGEIYFLYNKLFLDEGQADFSYTGNPTLFIDLLLTNINSTQSGWTKQTVDDAPQQTLIFNNDTCRTALTKIAEAFGMEYRLAGKEIYLQKSVGFATTYSFEYGRDKGLYTLTRENIQDKALITRVFGFGSTKNITTDYRNGSTRLVFEERYLENNTELYGTREGAVTFDDIFPQRTGTVTAINSQDILEFTDNALDFDINDNLIEGTTAKVVFKTGVLTGYEFEIKSFLNSDKKVFILPFTEENGYTLPNTLNYPEVGDEYTLVDIKMPAIYIDAAEALLKTKTQEYLNENSVPRVTYGVNLDEKYIRDNGVDLKVANLVQVKDEALGVDNTIRITEVSYPLVNTAQVTALISDTIPYTIQERLIADTIDNLTQTKNTDRRRAELARTSVARLRQLQDLVFDPDDYFDPSKIKPASIETLMLSVGAKSQNFGLLEVNMQANNEGDPSQFVVSGGQLVHYEIEIDGLGYVWSINGQTFSGLDPAKHYFLYAKCSKSALTGIWELSEVPRNTEEVAGQYLFNLGILYPEDNGRRDFDFTNGMTFINGDTITTGTIRSLDGLTFFNLTEGKFSMGNSSSSLDWNVTAPNQLTLRGSLVQNAAGTSFPIPLFRGNFSSSTIYYRGDLVIYNGSNYIKTLAAPGAHSSPLSSSWELYTSQGNNGADGQDGADGADGAPGADGENGPGIVFRGNHSASTAYYNNTDRRDVVLHLGTYYIYKGPDGAINAFTGSQWDNFGAQFTSVATNLLLAENANIGDWIIKSGKISSQAEFNSSPKVVLNGDDGAIEVQDGITVYSSTGSSQANVPFSAELSPFRQGLELMHDSANGQPFARVRLRPDQIHINSARPRGSGDVYDGRRRAIDADVSASQRDIVGTEYIAAVYGAASNTEGTNPAPAYGGYFEGLYMRGPIAQGIRRVGSSFTITDTSTDYIIICTTSITVTMPPNPQVGRAFIIKATNGAVTVHANTNQIYHNAIEGISLVINTNGMGFHVIFDGLYWQVIVIHG